MRSRESSAPLTSKRGFSVVAPISVTRPSSTAGSSASCWDLLKRWISSRKKTVRSPAAALARARSLTARTSARPDLDGAVLLERRAGRRRRSCARASSCPSPAARAGSSSAARAARSRVRSEEPSCEQRAAGPTKLVERARAHPRGERRGGAAGAAASLLARRASSIAPSITPSRATPEARGAGVGSRS